MNVSCEFIVNGIYRNSPSCGRPLEDETHESAYLSAKRIFNHVTVTSLNMRWIQEIEV